MRRPAINQGEGIQDAETSDGARMIVRGQP